MAITYGGSKPPRTICPPYTCHPIANKSRKYSQSDRNSIRDKVQRFSELKIIEPSNSRWRDQVLLVNKKKRRMVIDYSQTINKYTQLDAYPSPKSDELINKIA